MVDTAQLVTLMIMNTIGMSVLVETLMNAAYFYRHYQRNRYFYSECKDPIDRKEAKESYAFVQGTGLEMMLHYYHLEYDAEAIRQGLNFYLRKAES